MKEALAAFIRQVMARVDYFALYPARVASQNADDTLELVPDDARMPGVSRVPVRYGLPGARVEVQAGARVLLGFEGGDPRRPVATLWEAGDVVTRTELVAGLVALGAADPAQFVARAGDTDDRLSTIVAKLNELIAAFNSHTQGTPVGPTSPPLVPATTMAAPASVAASKVKAE